MGYLILIEPLCLYKHPLSLWVNNLIHFYRCCKKIVDVRKVFDEMPRRTVASWNSVMTTIVSLGDGIMYFFRMWGYAFEPDETCSHPFIYFFLWHSDVNWKNMYFCHVFMGGSFILHSDMGEERYVISLNKNNEK